MRLPVSIVLGAVLVAASACAPANNEATDVRVPSPGGSAPNDRVPSGAAGKIAADQVGKVSPVPAFRGGGAGWSIDIQAIGDMRHSVKLSSGQPARLREGTVVYQPLPPAAARAVIILDGTLYDARGDRAIGIKLARRDCTDAAGQVHRHGVQVDVDGEPALQGCGDLAMY